MDLLGFEDLMAEKPSVTQRLRSFTKIIRFIELCLALFLLWRFMNRLPLVVKMSGEFLRRVVVIIVSPLFIFILSNAIIATLIVKSGRFSTEDKNVPTAEDNVDTELYEKVLENSEIHSRPFFEEEVPPLSEEAVKLPEEVVYEDKEIVSEENTNTVPPSASPTGEKNDDVERDSGTVTMENPRLIRRTQSEKIKREIEPESKQLRRSETGKMKSEDLEEKIEDGMSNEEFQKTIEAFIEKQLQFRRQESLSMVFRSRSPPLLE